MVTFIMDQENRMEAYLKVMKTLIASCTELFPVVVESSEEEESSSSYSDLTPHDMVEIQGATVEGGNQHTEEVDQVEDIMAITVRPVSTNEVLVPNAKHRALPRTSKWLSEIRRHLQFLLRDFRWTTNCPHHWHRTLQR